MAKAPKIESSPSEAFMPGKRVQFDQETFQAIENVLTREGMRFEQLADEAFSAMMAGMPTTTRRSHSVLLRQKPGLVQAALHGLAGGSYIDFIEVALMRLIRKLFEH